MLNSCLELLKNSYPFKEETPEEFKSFNVAGMDFKAQGFEVENIGHASLMTAEGMGGMMKMATVMVNPTYVDGPLYSVDWIKVPGSDMIIVEFYDTLLDKELNLEELMKVHDKYAYLPDMGGQERWYDSLRFGSSISKKLSPDDKCDIEELVKDYTAAYLDVLKEAKSCDHDKKLEKARVYSHGLAENGGTAADNFIKEWGKEKTTELFDKVLFG